MRARYAGPTSMVFLLAAVVIGGLSGVATAGPNSNARILLHLAPATSKNVCEGNDSHPNCNAIDTSGSLYPVVYNAYVLIADSDSTAGVAGVQFGVDYDGASQSGVDIFGWSKCADLEFFETGWPAAGTGNVITWTPDTNCRRTTAGGTLPVGYFYCAAYSADALTITPRPSDGEALIVSCSSASTDTADVIESSTVTFSPSHLGSIVFSAGGTTSGNGSCGN